VILGDIAAPKDRGRYYAYFSATYTTAGACGPVLGGFLAEHVHWSAIFWLSVPLGLMAVALTFTLLRRLPRHDRPHKLDFLGAFLIMAASTTFMLALNLGGVRYAWTSPPVLALLAVALLIGCAFVWRLMTAPEPLIPLSILRDPVARCAFLINGCGWGSIIGLNFFLPMYLQSVVGLSATSSGLSLMVVMFALNFSAGTTGQILGRVRRYKIVPMIGIVISISAVLTLAYFAGEITPFWFEVVIGLMALGFGPIPPLTAVVLQNTVAPHQLGIAVGTMNFNRNLYATMMVASFGAIVLAGIPADGTGSLATGIAQNGVEGFRHIFLAAAASLSLSLLGIILLTEKPLRAGVQPS
jgi:predicted MFS family arabinose efflux permease